MHVLKGAVPLSTQGWAIVSKAMIITNNHHILFGDSFPANRLGSDCSLANKLRSEVESNFETSALCGNFFGISANLKLA